MPLSNYGIDLGNLYQQQANLRATKQGNTLRDMQLRSEMEKQQGLTTLRNLYAGNTSVGPNGEPTVDYGAVATGVAGGPTAEMTPGIITQGMAAKKAASEAGTLDAEQFAQLANGLVPDDEDSVIQFKEMLRRAGMNPQMIDSIPPTMTADQINQIRQAGLSAKESLTLEAVRGKASASYSDFKDIKVTEDGRLIGRRKGTGQYEYMEMPGEARASQPPIMYDTGQGVTPMTRKQALDVARTGGVLPKVQQIPAAVVKNINDNDLNLQKVNDALDATNPFPTPEMRKRLRERKITWDPKAFGKKTLTPGIILDRTDPTGTDARAIAADLGSMTIHSRSGAAVTAAEFPRLKPFIPSAGDDGPTVRKKLEGFKREYAMIQAELKKAYSAERGFIPLNLVRQDSTKDTWEDETYQYRRLSDGTVQRKKK